MAQVVETVKESPSKCGLVKVRRHHIFNPVKQMTIKNEIPTTNADSVASLLHQVSKKYAGNDNVLFRGQQNETWKMTPRLGRLDARLKFAAKQAPVIEKMMLDDFRRLAGNYLSPGTQLDEWNLMALAQHHGLPTRLLDWSSNPLVALWFAIEKPADGSTSAAVWAYNAEDAAYVVESSRPAELTRTLVFRPTHRDARIVAQSGWFTAHRFDPSSDRFSIFERTSDRPKRLHKYVIPATSFAAIREDLARCGVTHASLFPDLAGLCKHLTWKYEQLADESAHDASNFL
jgi:hypothetical protein